MATVNTRSINPGGGGDYTSLSAWWAARKGDLVADDRVEIAEVYDGVDSTALNASGADVICDAAHYFLVRPAVGYEHGGVFTTSKYVFTNTIIIGAPHFHISGILQQYTATATNKYAISCTGTTGENKFDSIIQKIQSSYTGTVAIRGSSNGGTRNISNCVAYFAGGTATDARAYGNNYGYAYIYNCTAYSFAVGFYRNTTTTAVKNCLAQNCADGFLGAFDSSSTNNCSNVSGDAPGANAVTGTAVFVDATTGDFHLSSSDTVSRGVGADLSADAVFPVTTDIDGETIATWSIGADSVAAGASGVVGSLTLALENATMTAAATAACPVIQGQLSRELENAALVSTATAVFPAVQAGLAASLDAAALSATAAITGATSVDGQASAVLEDASLAATAEISGVPNPAIAALDVTLEAIGLSATAVAAFPVITASLAQSLDDSTLAATATAAYPIRQANLAVTLEGVALVAAAEVTGDAITVATPPERTVYFDAESRVVEFLAESRTVNFESESRYVALSA